MTQIENTMKKITRKMKRIAQLEDNNPNIDLMNQELMTLDHELEILFYRLALQKLGLDWSEVKALVQDIERQYTR